PGQLDHPAPRVHERVVVGGAQPLVGRAHECEGARGRHAQHSSRTRGIATGTRGDGGGPSAAPAASGGPSTTVTSASSGTSQGSSSTVPGTQRSPAASHPATSSPSRYSTPSTCSAAASSSGPCTRRPSGHPPP